NQQAAIGPATALHDQGPEIWRRGAITQTFRIVHQRPAMQCEVNTRLGILNHRAILDETAYFETADPFGFGNIIKRAFANDRVGTDPEGCPVMAHALVENVLDVC